MRALKTIDLFDRLLGNVDQSANLQSGWNIRLHAKHPQKNIFRWYSLRVDQNLFGEWCLSISYGRIGQRGQSKQYQWSELALLMIQIKAILRKRLNATNRIGCNYEIVTFSR
ncbi:MAG: WGR domain-containing protein [Alphaproteobacteria bacterium]|nr:WGR domain-containing protein [Alphaproteobacteria bacterium]